MKYLINTNLALVGLLVSSTAMAQNNPGNTSVTAQITMTRGYTQSILTKIGNVPADRFNESSDYSKVGPTIKAQMEAALTDFRRAMDILMVGSLTDSIASYNETYLDTKIPDAERTTALKLQRQVLNQQVLSASAVYQNEIKRLYQILPEMNLIRFAHNGERREGKVYGEFQDGTSEFFYNGNYRETATSEAATWTDYFLNRFVSNYDSNNGALISMYRLKFDRFLKKNCQTRVCASGALQQLSNYLLYVGAYLNRNIALPLADGTTVQIEALAGKPGCNPAIAIATTITTFSFDASYTGLTLKN